MIVRPVSAALTVDKDTFGKQDPYCILNMNGQKHRTATCSGGGKNPTWNDTFTFNGSGNLNIEVWDDDPGLDDKIGEGDYDLRKVNLMGGQQTITVPLFKGIFKSNVGSVRLLVRGAGGPGQQPGGQQGWNQGGQQQGGWGGQQGGQQGWGGNQGGQGGWGQQGGQQGGWGGQQGGQQGGWGQGGQQQGGWGQQQGGQQGGWGGNQGGQGGWGGNQGSGW